VIRTIDTHDLRVRLERDFPISLRPWTTDQEIVREMVSRGLDRRNTTRPEKDRRKIGP